MSVYIVEIHIHTHTHTHTHRIGNRWDNKVQLLVRGLRKSVKRKLNNSFREGTVINTV